MTDECSRCKELEIQRDTALTEYWSFLEVMRKANARAGFTFSSELKEAEDAYNLMKAEAT